MDIRKTIQQNPKTLIGRAGSFARQAHEGQYRKSGEQYFNHCLLTAQALMDWHLDEVTIAAGLLHDVVEDTPRTLDEVKKEFGEEVAFLVDGVTKLGRVKYRGVESQAGNLRKMILAMAEDLRVILIKLADRRHNMLTLNALPPQKQKRIAQETLEIYSPLAYRLGMQKLSGELEDLAFPYIYPKEYQWLLDRIKDQYDAREAYLQRIRPLVEEALRSGGIESPIIDFRAKRYASLYKKLLRYEMDLDKIHDLVAFRIVVKTVEECYGALGTIHKLWPPLPGRIKDYIAMPKPNRYRSIHTTVFCQDHRVVEFQIRTQEMHDEAENGIAAHWAYEQFKGTKHYIGRQAVLANTREMAWVEQLRAWQNDFASDEGFIDALKIDFFKDRIFVITPRGGVIDLPQGSTPVDFAYQIHSEIGNQCVGARVNGKIVSLDHKLQSSDIVEVITQKNKKPSLSWFDFTVTASAKKHIRAALKSGSTKGSGLLLKEPEKVIELKLTVENRIGMLKDVSSIISRSHINILSINSVVPARSGKFHVLKIKCDTSDKTKIWKIITKLKSIKEVKEIDYRFV